MRIRSISAALWRRIDAFQQHGEFIAAEPRRQAARRNGCSTAGRQSAADGRRLRGAPAVVHVVKMIDIEQGQAPGVRLPRPALSRSASCCSQARRLGKPVSGSDSARCVSTFSCRRLASRCRRSRTISASSRHASRSSRERMIGRQRHIGRQPDADRDHAHLSAGQTLFVERHVGFRERLIDHEHVDIVGRLAVARDDLAAGRPQGFAPGALPLVRRGSPAEFARDGSYE